MAVTYLDLQARTLSMLFRFVDLQNRFFDGFEGVTRAEAHSVHSLYLLERLDFCPSCRPGEIASKLKISPSAFSQMLKALEAKGLVERTRSSEDCRAVRICLTEAGRQLGQRINEEIGQQFDQVIGFAGEERFLDSLNLFEEAMDMLDKTAAAKGGDAE